MDGSGDVPTIQAALDSAVSGNIVDVGPGTYHEHLSMGGGRNILLRGRFGAESTIIDGDNSGTVVQLDAGTLEDSRSGTADTEGKRNLGFGKWSAVLPEVRRSHSLPVI